MELKEYEQKIGQSIDKMTYEEMYGFLQTNKETSVSYFMSCREAYWLGKLYNEGNLTKDEFKKWTEVLRSAIRTSKQFHRIYIEAEDPTGKEKDHWEFYLSN